MLGDLVSPAEGLGGREGGGKGFLTFVLNDGSEGRREMGKHSLHTDVLSHTRTNKTQTQESFKQLNTDWKTSLGHPSTVTPLLARAQAWDMNRGPPTFWTFEDRGAKRDRSARGPHPAPLGGPLLTWAIAETPPIGCPTGLTSRLPSLLGDIEFEVPLPSTSNPDSQVP